MMHFVQGAMDRFWRPYFFVYDFTAHTASVSYRVTRVWLIAWLMMDLLAQHLSGPILIWDTVISFITFLFVWHMPPLLATALAGTHLVRALASIGILFSGGLGVTLETAEMLMLVIQLWALGASLGLMLRYIRTPKKNMPPVVGQVKKI